MKYYCEYCDFRTIRKNRLDNHNKNCLFVKDNFDWKFYISYYDDLRKAGIINKKLASQHWKKYGKKAGRDCNLIDNEIKKKFIKCKMKNLIFVTV